MYFWFFKNVQIREKPADYNHHKRGCGSVDREVAVRGSNPVIGKIYIEHLFTVICIGKRKIKEKEALNGPFLF